MKKNNDMRTPKEQAYYLVNKYESILLKQGRGAMVVNLHTPLAVEVAKITVQSIIDSEPKYPFSERTVKRRENSEMV